ncbi:alpha/beta hydrolase family esterase [Streptomyces sp. NPDC048172]|uniref:alpha/beta hydrolase family esterase n=1 Tax=Streptomyces sp. NPDC048172 TaxID=3365505 RepID=UPI003711AF80
MRGVRGVRDGATVVAAVLGLALCLVLTALTPASASDRTVTSSGLSGLPGLSGLSGPTGCGKDPGQSPGTSRTRTLTSGGKERTYAVHLPEHYRPDRPTPVILAFHGQGRTSAYMEELTGFSETDALAVYPQGLPGTEEKKPAWQGAPYSAPGVDDVRFTRDLIDALERDLCVDPARIHAAGKSNGGAFTALLACRMPERIASFSAVSGAYYPQAGPCEPSRAAPLLTLHGGADPTIPYGGDPAKGLPPIPDWLAGRAALAGCDARSHDRSWGAGVTTRTWHGCEGRGALHHVRLATLAHDWPSTTPNPDSDTPAALDATPLIRHFMRTHPLN